MEIIYHVSIAKTARALRVNEIKITLQNAFIADLCFYAFSRTVLVLGFFWGGGHFVLRLEIKTKLIAFCTQFQVKQVKFLPSNSNSLLLHGTPVQQNFLYFFKNS